MPPASQSLPARRGFGKLPDSWQLLPCHPTAPGRPAGSRPAPSTAAKTSSVPPMSVAAMRCGEKLDLDLGLG